MDAFIAGAWRSPSRAEVLAGGTWRRVSRAEGYIGGQWRTIVTFVPPLSLSITPSSVSGYANPFKPVQQTITTGLARAVPTGGFAPFTYVWSGGNTPTQASTSFTRSVPANTELSSTYSVTATDSLGATASASVEATFTNESQTG